MNEKGEHSHTTLTHSLNTHTEKDKKLTKLNKRFDVLVEEMNIQGERRARAH